MSSSPKKIAGMVWYRQEQFEAAIAIMEDAGKLPRNYHIWRMNAESNEKRIQRLGFSTVRAYIDPTTFPDWCRARGLNIDSKARQEYANLIAYEAATSMNT